MHMRIYLLVLTLYPLFSSLLALCRPFEVCLTSIYVYVYGCVYYVYMIYVRICAQADAHRRRAAA